MAYQSTYFGFSPETKTNNLLLIAKALRSDLNPALEQYAQQVGKEITEETDREALIKARSTEARSYAKAVENGEIDGTQSPYWQSVYDNAKGKAHGIEYSTLKQNSLNDWVLENKQMDPDWVDKDGSKYQEWSASYDAEYFSDALEGESNFFLKGLDQSIQGTNINLAANFYSSQQKAQKEILNKNMTVIFENAIEQTFNQPPRTDAFQPLVSTEDMFDTLMTEGDNAKYLAGLTGDEINTLGINAFKSVASKYAIVGDENADFDKAISILDIAEKFKRDNGSTLFNAESKADFSDFRQSLIAEKERHENLMTAKRNEILTTEIVKDAVKLLEDRFVDPYGAELDVDNQKRANKASEAVNMILREWSSTLVLDYEDDDTKNYVANYANEVSEYMYQYYKQLSGEEIQPFAINDWKKMKEAQRIKTIIPLQFNSLEELKEAKAEYNMTRGGLFADLAKTYGVEFVDVLVMQQLEKFKTSGLQ